MLFYFGEDQSTHIMYTFLLREKYYFHRFSDNQVAINLDPTVVLVRNGNIVSLTCFDKGLKKKKKTLSNLKPRVCSFNFFVEKMIYTFNVI